MAYNSDDLLRGVAFVLLLANVWVLWRRDDKATCPVQEPITIRSAAQRCGDKFSPSLPDKCASLLRGVDPREGLVLGKPREKKVFLTVGVAVWDDHVENIRPMLTSFITHVTPEDANNVTMVISVSPKHSSSVKQLLEDEFNTQVQSGLVHLISPTAEYIRALSKRPSLGSVYLKEFSTNFTEKIFEINKNIGFLLYYSQRLSEFMLHLSDQNTVNDRFLPDIKHHVVKNQKRTYFALLFSHMKLMHSSVLDTLNEFYAMFGLYNSPAILEQFRSAKVSRSDLIDTELDLFPLRSIRGNRPTATLETSLTASDKEHGVENIYNNDSQQMFWALTPKKDDYLQLTFDDAIKLSRVQIVTGSPFMKDTPEKAVLRACPAREQSRSCDLTKCQEIVTFGDPVQDIRGLENAITFPVKCLRLEFKDKANSWVMIRDLAVWTA